MLEETPLWQQLAAAALITIGVLGVLISKRTRKPTAHVGDPCAYCRQHAGVGRPKKCPGR